MHTHIGVHASTNIYSNIGVVKARSNDDAEVASELYVIRRRQGSKNLRSVLKSELAPVVMNRMQVLIYILGANLEERYDVESRWANKNGDGRTGYGGIEKAVCVLMDGSGDGGRG